MLISLSFQTDEPPERDRNPGDPLTSRKMCYIENTYRKKLYIMYA